MRIFWIILLATAALAAAWSFWPEDPRRGEREAIADSTGSDFGSVAESAPRRDPSEMNDLTAAPASPEAPTSTDAAAPEMPETTDIAASEIETTPDSPLADREAATEAATLPLGLEASIPDATVVAGSIIRGPKDVLLADDRFEIEGDGTREKPYRVSWELLVSAGESYRPRVGDRGIPQRIAMLDGKWVAIDGYVAFPMLVGTTSEALVMLNRWDGCCIGVPPSPYDAIEVKLDRPVVRTQMHAIDYGEVVGVLEVEPYLVDDWLVGLYLMDDATMKLDL